MTEGIAFRQTADLVNEFMDRHGIEERYSGEKLVGLFMGLTFKQMMPKIAEYQEFELTDEELKFMIKREEEEVVKAIKKEAKACVGVKEVLEKLKKDAKWPIAVVSSSSIGRITATLEKADLLQFFDNIYSAQSSLPVPTGKPEPDVYLYAMKELGLKAEECITVEDSRTGMRSAVAAKVPVIGYVGCYSARVKQVQLEHDFGLLKAVTTMYEWKDFHSILEEVTATK